MKNELKIDDSKLPSYREFFNSKFSLNSANKLIINEFIKFDSGGEVYERSPIELSADQKAKLAAALSKQVGQPVRVNVETNPKVIGGVSIRFRDELIDGTVISRMAEASQAFAGK